MTQQATKTLQEEKQIIEKVLQGAVSEYRILVERYQNPVYNLMLRLTGSVPTAEDLTQEVFLKAYQSLPGFNRNRRLFPWLYTIALNRCRDYLRRRGIRKSLFAENRGALQLADPDGDSCSKRADCTLEVKQVSEAMQKLPFIYSEVLFMFYREELSIKEIAEAMGISIQTTKVRLHRGRELLKYMMGADNEKR